MERADFRWGGSESGTVEYPCWSSFPNPFSHNKFLDQQSQHLELLKHGDVNGKYWLPAMADAPLRGYNGRHEWFWEPGDEEAVYPLSHLTEMYYKSVGRNATLILGLTPDPHGLLPDGDVKRLQEFGDKIEKLTGTPLATIKGEGREFTIDLQDYQQINQVILKEEILMGERICEDRVKGLTSNGWTILCEGESVGHKSIQTFEPTSVIGVRWVINECIAIPQIKNFSVFNVDM